MTKIKLFFTALVTTTIVLLAIFYVSRPSAKYHLLADGVFVSKQLTGADMGRVKSGGIKTIVDLRPDGEATDETPSETLKIIAEAGGIGFNYIPVPHEEIPDKAMTELSDVLAHQPKPALLYCRTGRRAARTFALVEAARSDGPGWDEIKRMVVDAGFSADDLKEKIQGLITKRKTLQAARN